MRNLPAPHAHTCCLQACLCSCPCPGLLAGMPTRCCPLWGGGCWPALQRQRRSLLSAGTKEPKAAAVSGANTGRVRPGRWATASACHAGIPAHPSGARSREALSPCRGMGVPPAPRCRGAEAMWAPQGSAASPCCAPLCSPQLRGYPHAVQQCGLRVPIAAPCWASPHLGWGSGRKR